MFSKTKRFQDPSADGPAPGQYDVTEVKKSIQNVKFTKGCRWKNGQDDLSTFGSSLDNLSGSGSFTCGKSLVPKCQSTCRKPSNKRKSYFVSSSASDLSNVRTSLEKNLNAECQGDEINKLKATIRKLEFDIAKSKASLERAQSSNEELKASIDGILNEKLTTELAKQELERKVKGLQGEESARMEDMLKSYEDMQVSVHSMIEEITNRYKILQRAFDEIQTLYEKRLEKATMLLGRTKVANDNRFLQFEQLEKTTLTLKNDFAVLLAENSAKDKLLTDQEQQLTEFKESTSSLAEEVKSKEACCEDLSTKLNDINEETKRKDEEFAQVKENLLRQVIEHEGEMKKLNCELLSSQNLNTEYSEQIENIEHSMTQNIREITGKYECLEENFEKVHEDYQSRLERSNSLVEKTVLAHKKSTDEFENLQTLYTDLQNNYRELTEESENKMVLLTEREDKLQEYEEGRELLLAQLDSLMKEKEEEYQLLNKKVEELTKVKQENQEEFEEEKQGLLRGLREMEATHEHQCQLLNKKVEDLTEVLQQTQEELEGEKENLTRELAELKAAQEENSAHINQEDLDELQSKLLQAEETGESWRVKYEDLERKVAPFLEQLEQYEFEKSSLLNQNSYTQQELKKLSEKYGQMLGHQNNKQKIRHISKLKEEHHELKAEVQRLKANASKDKIKISQLESRTSQNEKRFDPAKSFLHAGKENIAVADKENNRNVLKTVNSW